MLPRKHAKLALAFLPAVTSNLPDIPTISDSFFKELYSLFMFVYKNTWVLKLSLHLRRPSFA